MLENQDIICIANTPWEGEYAKSTVQLMSRLAKKNRILYVEYPFTWKDVITTAISSSQAAPIHRMLGLKSSLKTIKTDLSTEVYNLVPPPVLPVRFIKSNSAFDFVFKINVALYRRRLRKAMDKIGMKHPVVIGAYNPMYGLPLIGSLEEDLNIYYSYDGIAVRQHGERIYGIDEAYCKKVDAVITSSEFLKKQKSEHNSNCHVVSNGVDFETFNRHVKTKVSDAEHKTVGYIGSLDHRFDIDLVEHAVKKFTNFSFEFTGNLRNKDIKNRLEKYDNVAFHGSVKPDEVPAIMSKFDVGIIPYIQNEINKNIYPLKINEYFAVGVPTVMTNFASLPEFKDSVSVTEGNEEFSQALLSEIENDSLEKIEERISIARGNSWDNKAALFEKLIAQFLKIK